VTLKCGILVPGASFKAHKDTPRSKDMFGSIVVVFPTRKEGGKLLPRHGEKEQEFNSAEVVAEQASPVVAYVAYVAFFSDVEREVTPVTSGHRITLTYNLYSGAGFGNEDVTPAPLSSHPTNQPSVLPSSNFCPTRLLCLVAAS
jgi:hypothetical protein